MTRTHRIAFQFDDKLPFQQEAVRAVVELFRGLPRVHSGIYRVPRAKKRLQDDPVRNIEIVEGSRLLDNLRGVQLSQNLFADTEVRGNNFTVEMETGTGKTYVYLRTILELHKEYGFTKFMIVVPSIAIRKGVEKTISMLREHFKALYDLDIDKHSFVYDSKQMRKIESIFVSNDQLSICVMNYQAFNRDTTKIRKEDEYGQILWEDIKYIRPIVIIDEPQKIEGTKSKKSASLKALEEIHPLFTLRYSATHKQLYNQIYKLDSFEAFRQDLVKKIEVKTVHGTIPKDFPYVRYVSFTRDLKAKIEIFTKAQGEAIRFKTFDVVGGASLYELSGNLKQYHDMRIFEDPHKEKPLVVAKKSGFDKLPLGSSTYEIRTNEAVRIQIRLTIEKHLEKQFAILDAGERIKVLSLFFIDAVDKVRSSKEKDGRGEYLRIFDEEYETAVRSKRFTDQFKKYADFFPQYKNTNDVREGYFARDKKNAIVDVEGWDSDSDDGKVSAKSQEDIDRGIELILEKKDELISFEEPLAFIFSHSALREGWDNPNVFVLCTLKSGGSEIAKKQEIGRGLRLPVTTSGGRCLDSRINELTIIANDYYDHFAENLQRDFNEQMSFNKDEVTLDLLQTTLKKAGLPKEHLTPELVNTFREELFTEGIVTVKNVLTGQAERILDTMFTNPHLKEHAIKIREAFVTLMREKGSRKIPIKNGDNPDTENGPHDYVGEGVFAEILKTLSSKLSKRAIYKMKLDKEKFIRECIDELNEHLRSIRLKEEYRIESGKAAFDETRKFKMNAATTTTIDMENVDHVRKKSDFELVNELMFHTMLPRLAILRILWGLERKEFLSDQDIFDKVVQVVLTKLQNAKSESICEYEVISGYEFETKVIFETDVVNEEMFEQTKRVYQTRAAAKRAVNKLYLMDSDGEYDFAAALEADENVLLFTKLKRGGFVIETPYGHYSPDWAIVYRLEDGELKLYFVVETKPGKEYRDLSDVEKFKIRCGKLHFKAVSDLIRFEWVNSYDQFRAKAK